MRLQVKFLLVILSRGVIPILLNKPWHHVLMNQLLPYDQKDMRHSFKMRSSYLYALFSINGITAGAHRLWTHRTYKANLPLRIFLMFWQTAALQNDIYIWSRDHRVHHKFTDTDADPHNSKRGFFFSHVGWLLCKKHRDVIEKGKTIDMSDVLADPVVQFQRKFYVPLILLTTFVLPTWIPVYFWGESLKVSFISTITRYVLSLNGTWCINSVTHMFGTKPYDKSISSVQNVTMGLIGLGEGWHNYHHTFPWDYRAHEFANFSINMSGAFITFMSKIGWATELKVVPDEAIRRRALRTGDGSRANINTLNKEELISRIPENYNNNVWGYGDKDIENEEVQILKAYS
ncbi:hypothetical protein GWI33_003457 [Rhynchophorus ferrugineus]|uniref:Fatty acid desaturase domain-containing protein n=1 Tax=Rhynchophorus ferrugineus TaxID=354439 RepID=A0A834J2Y3_RHYFE|nr:hypothetical protein GWI33_003457 [Rhynchophorus ferrugineus]